jgi:hypothetical protein
MSGQEVTLDANTSTGSTGPVDSEAAESEAANERVGGLVETIEQLRLQNDELTRALAEKEAALRSKQQNGTTEDGVCPQPATEPSEDQQVVLVYLTCDQMTDDDNRVVAGLVPVRHIVVEDGDTLAASMGALLSGPTNLEETAGYSSWFLPATADALIGADIEGDAAVIDLDAALTASLNNVSTSTGGAYFRGQLYGTAFANAPVDSVEFQLDGDPARFCALMELISDCTPITRSEWNRDYTQTGN